MKIRTIELTNVRRFEGRRAVISDIADGVTTICEPNESGKSTFFDALQVVLLVDHKSTAAQVKSLQPYSKGAVEIAVEIEAEGRRYRIEKRYLSRKAASIVDVQTGRLIAQEGEAEAWIANLLGSDIEGPAGLLWVRQGVSGFGPDGTGAAEKRERDKLRDARQTLMSSVAGQIDSVTGGRKMDAIMKAVEADLDAIATKSGAPKVSGEWGKVSQRLSELNAERVQLCTQLAELQGALRERSEIRSQLRAIDDPELDAERDAAIATAQSKLDEVKQRLGAIEGAARDTRLASLEVDGLRTKHEAIETLIGRATKAEVDLDGLVKSAGSSQQALEAARLRLSDAKTLHESARGALDESRKAVARSQSAVSARKLEKEVLELRRQLARADAYETSLHEAETLKRGISITADDLAHIEDLSGQIERIESRLDALAPTVRFAYCSELRVEAQGAVVEEGQDLRIKDVVEISIPGIGIATVSPGLSQADGSDKARLQAQLEDALASHSVENLKEARVQARRLSEAEQSRMLAKASIDAIAPDGVERMRSVIAELERDLANAAQDLGEHEVSSDGDVHERLRVAMADEARLRLDWETALTAHQEASQVMAGRRAALEIAEAAVADARDALGEDAEARLSEISILLEKSVANLSEAQSREDELRANAPDVEMFEADLTRLVSARDNGLRQRKELLARSHQLDGLIGARAEDGIEERYETVLGQIEKAQRREARYAAEAKALAELRDVLETTRREARDAYFEPIKAELGPLLSVLHSDAKVEMDSESMLPSRLYRGDVEDSFDTLSGGAAEQIAILTRLAFARLFARAGRAVPVILDDALVYSDDDRIVRMFTALTKISKDQQIIVFSCRNKAFEQLGGHRPRISVDHTAAA